MRWWVKYMLSRIRGYWCLNGFVVLLFMEMI